jgi:hypothetical protein
MRLDAIFKYHFTFEYWTLRVNAAGTTEYVFEDERKGMFLPGGSMTMSLITKEAMDTPMQIRNLRDRSGNVMFAVNGEPDPRYVTSCEPQLDPFSSVIAYKHSLRKTLPADYSDLISFALNDG